MRRVYNCKRYSQWFTNRVSYLTIINNITKRTIIRGLKNEKIYLKFTKIYFIYFIKGHTKDLLTLLEQTYLRTFNGLIWKLLSRYQHLDYVYYNS